jgi:hypothetical protein
VVVLKGQGSPTPMALMAFRNHEAARAMDGGADYRPYRDLPHPSRAAKVGIRSKGGGM